MTAHLTQASGTPALAEGEPVAASAAPWARDILEDEIRRSPVADRLKVHRIVVRHKDRIVAKGSLDGRPCFVKLFITAEPDRMARLAETAVAEARRHMSDGPFRVAPTLFTARLRGFIVLEPAPGISLETAMGEADAEERARLIRLAGRWLDAYCAPRREMRRFSAERFRAFHAPRMATPGWKGQLRDSPLIRAMGEHLAGLAVAAEGAPISVAVAHGDFVGRNFHHDRGTITAFDIEWTRALPVAWDMAMFLVDIANREGAIGGPTWCGVPAADAEALVGSGLIGEEEAAVLLPLYIGHHLLRRCIRMGPAPPFLDNMREAAARFLSETG